LGFQKESGAALGFFAQWQEFQAETGCFRERLFLVGANPPLAFRRLGPVAMDERF
jgi:hypothetical protein